MADTRKNEWRWQGPVGGATAEAFAEEIYLVLEAAHDRNMVGQWSTGSYAGDHSDRIEADLLPRLLDFMRLLVMASKPTGGIPFNEPLREKQSKCERCGGESVIDQTGYGEYRPCPECNEDGSRPVYIR